MRTETQLGPESRTSRFAALSLGRPALVLLAILLLTLLPVRSPSAALARALPGGGIPLAGAAPHQSRPIAVTPNPSPTSPPARYGAAMDYDAATGTVILFSGAGGSSTLNDTWSWDGNTWTQLHPATSPSPRYYLAMAYDAATSTVLLFGGFNSGYFDDSWSWNGTTWTNVTPSPVTNSNTPAGRYAPTMTYDGATGMVLLFGGSVSAGTSLNDTWIWDGSAWAQISITISPPGRYLGSMTYDGSTGMALIFGGFSGSASLGDTWVWNGGARPLSWCSSLASPAAPPCIVSVSPSAGPAAGGTSVTISGMGFTSATAVSFGGTPASSFNVNTDTSITATAPPGTLGTTVDILVTTPAGTSALGPLDRFSYPAPPTVTSISPASGPAGGGTTVTINGTGFSTVAGQTTVQFGSVQAQIAAPPSEGAMNRAPTSATSTTPVGAQGLAPLPPAGATSAQPATGSVSVACPSSTLCYAITPAGTGAVDVTVTAGGQTSATSSADRFTYVASGKPPSVTSVSPRSGSTNGGTSVTVSGTGFTGATAVAFGSTPASSFTINSDSSITATAPAGTAGTVVDVTITTPVGASSPSAADGFTFLNTGDVNADGHVTSVDALCVLRQVAGLPGTAACPQPLPGNPIIATNETSANGPTAVDALCIPRGVAGLPGTANCPAISAAAAAAAAPTLPPEGAMNRAPTEGRGESSRHGVGTTSGEPGALFAVVTASQPGPSSKETTIDIQATLGAQALGAWSIDVIDVQKKIRGPGGIEPPAAAERYRGGSAKTNERCNIQS